ncbi:MAG: tRNA uridine-5-carboxymethylaminomethyl(34) synthesis GTPase MnmE [Ruminiclostridium sp.]|nr:tRNA uridine-5-carboxymethylaminomethyl(34) synthesis GTPase MnmE [Ruminiclostridium sp.]
MHLDETIAAISTPHGTGGIGIIRISGERTFQIAEKLFTGKKPFDEIKTHTINYGKIVNPINGDMIDEVLLTKMKRPHTFTREDVVEINCHGGAVVLLRILELVVKEGARPAEPGEFTKRAFLNGRLDLSQAEAVIDLINAKTIEGSGAAAAQLEGKLSEKIKSLRSRLIGLIANIEVTVDYPEHDIEEITGREVYENAGAILESLVKMAESFDKGRILREGIRVVIAGKPNVGKSSLLNELAGKNKAIVTNVPGTTRDIIEEYVSIRGIPVKLSDTAGIRKTDDPVEKIGVEKAEGAIEAADLVILMLDASQGLDDDDKGIIGKLSGKKIIYIINKTDIADEAAVLKIEEQVKQREQRIIRASMLSGKGLEELEAAIEELFIKGNITINNEVLVTGVRHKNLLDMAAASLKEACRAYEGSMPLDMITIDIKNAAEYLGQITGEAVSEDVVREIFSRFCIGK